MRVSRTRRRIKCSRTFRKQNPPARSPRLLDLHPHPLTSQCLQFSISRRSIVHIVPAAFDGRVQPVCCSSYPYSIHNAVRRSEFLRFKLCSQCSQPIRSFKFRRPLLDSLQVVERDSLNLSKPLALSLLRCRYRPTFRRHLCVYSIPNNHVPTATYERLNLFLDRKSPRIRGARCRVAAPDLECGYFEFSRRMKYRPRAVLIESGSLVFGLLLPRQRHTLLVASFLDAKRQLDVEYEHVCGAVIRRTNQVACRCERLE